MPGERSAEQSSEIREFTSANKNPSLRSSIWHKSIRMSRKANWTAIPM